MTGLFEEPKAITTQRPSWCSEGLWHTLSGRMTGGRLAVEVCFSGAERKVLRKRRPVKVSVWAEKHRILTMSALPGVWRNEVTPYLTGIMDAGALPFVREIVVCKTPQTGGSEGVHNFVGYCIDRAPGPVLYVYPDEKTAAENSKDRILPMIKSSPRLRTYLTGTEKDASALRINLAHMPVYLGWARSVASIANKPIKYAIADEIDKDGFDPGKKEAGPLDLIDKRLTTFRPVSKYWKISTPTLESGNIWKALNDGTDVIFDYHVKCPLCGMQQLMAFSGIKWEGGSKSDPREIKNRKRAWYECAHCQGRWDDDVRNRAVRSGLWIARGHILSMDAYLTRFRPANIGFHIPAWISYFVSLSECAAAFLEGLTDPLKMQDFLNAFCALPWKDIVIKKDEAQVLSLRNRLAGGVVPKDAVALTCGIDVQMHGFWFVVRAWTKDLSSHLVQYGHISTWADVETLVFHTRYPVDGKSADETMGIWRAAIDTGGGKDREEDWSKTEEIYEWVRKNCRGVVFAVKGASAPQVKKVTPRVIDKMTRGNRVIPGGLVLYFLDTDKFKELFFWRLSRTPDETQAMSLHADTDMNYARQILAEQKQKDKQGKVTWVAIRRDNHLLDCEIYAAAAADPEWMPSLSFIAARTPEPGPSHKPETTPPVRTGRHRPGWFHSR